MKENKPIQRFVGHLALALGIVTTLVTFSPLLDTRADNGGPGVFLPQIITVLNDSNRNGKLDADEPGINGVKVCAASANVDNGRVQCALTGDSSWNQGQVIFAVDPTEAYRFTLEKYPPGFFPTSATSIEGNINMENRSFGLGNYYKTFLPLIRN